jgi:hypothetical protein
MTTKTRDNIIYLSIGSLVVGSLYWSVGVEFPASTIRFSLQIGTFLVAVAFMLYGGVHQHRRLIRRPNFWALLGLLTVVYAVLQWYLVIPQFRDPLLSLLSVGPEMFVFLTALDLLLRYL